MNEVCDFRCFGKRHISDSAYLLGSEVFPISRIITQTWDFEVGEWVLIEHGRWTRGIEVEFDGEKHELRMVEAKSVLAYSQEKPNDELRVGTEYTDGQHATVDPQHFVNEAGRAG